MTTPLTAAEVRDIIAEEMNRLADARLAEQYDATLVEIIRKTFPTPPLPAEVKS